MPVHKGWPEAHWGTYDTPLPDWRSQPAPEDPDDELVPTPPDVIEALGFDPMEWEDEESDDEAEAAGEDHDDDDNADDHTLLDEAITSFFASDEEWDETKVKRDDEGKFARQAGGRADISDSARDNYFDAIENVITTEGIEAAEDNWRGGVADFGDPESAILIQDMPGYFDYRSDLEDAAREHLGDEFSVYRVMRQSQIDAWKAGDDMPPMATSTSEQFARSFTKFAGFKEREGEDYMIVRIPATPNSLIMRGSAEESELVIDANDISADTIEVLGKAIQHGERNVDPPAKRLAPMVPKTLAKYGLKYRFSMQDRQFYESDDEGHLIEIEPDEQMGYFKWEYTNVLTGAKGHGDSFYDMTDRLDEAGLTEGELPDDYQEPYYPDPAPRPTPPTIRATPGDYPKGEMRLNVRGADTVSSEFMDIVNDAAQRIPHVVQDVLNDFGAQISVGKTVTDTYPELKRKRPRGWGGVGWDNATGLYKTADKHIVATEFKRRGGQRGELKPAGRTEGTIFHEAGHALDAALQYMSKSEPFRNAYEKDKRVVKRNNREGDHGYLLQKGDAGPSEAFAEVFAFEVGVGPNGPRDDPRNDFPNCTKEIRGMLQRMVEHDRKRKEAGLS